MTWVASASATVPGATLDTARLHLRELQLDDAAFILELLNEPGFLTYIGDKGVRDLDAARDYIVKGPVTSYLRNGFGLYAVTLHEHDAPVGMCGLVKRDGLDDVDLGFAFLARYQSRGYATEAGRAVLRHAAEGLRIARVVAITAIGNTASIAVLEKLGMRFEGMIRLPQSDADVKLFAPAG